MTWYCPHDAWPSHPKQWWREALECARAAGWYLRKSEAHTWGTLYCGRDATGRCSIPIFTTGKGGETVARGVPKKVQKCPHRRVTSPTDATPGLLARATELLDGADRLMGAVRMSLDGRTVVAHAIEILDSVDVRLADAEELFETLAEREAEGDALHRRGTAELSRILDGDVPTLARAMDAVDEQLNDADDAVSGAAAAAAGTVRSTVRDRLAASRNSATQLRRDLSSDGQG